eukprot:CAMPEP_0204910720 /NCGR_PEP_ID=MMETSP1397-20131031/9184_1 /ASSEMBLY_ACC=CAM_ASM_000891 /TAXON_ID=49980 /ORGANISM="Climacostomum Climacostomum virens, Strain Stock W-24" /LENGTH=44 /DNA_ID= /DNA_START= /DNA_END= /DNA_ORIENTATION=
MEAGYSITLAGSDCMHDLSLIPSGILCITSKGLEAVKSPMESEF